MEMERCTRKSFAVIGKLGSTDDGKGFIQNLWADANAHFAEVQPIAKYDENGMLCGIWGAMSDRSGSFQPWEDGFSKGLYLAGVECDLDAEPPEGWTKWVIPAYEYMRVENDQPDTFARAIAQLEKQQLPLAGAVQEFTCPQSGKSYLYCPVKCLSMN